MPKIKKLNQYLTTQDKIKHLSQKQRLLKKV